MDYQHDAHCDQSQEIDLVDIVAVLYRRRVALFIVAALCIAASIAYWSTTRETSEITMTFVTGQNGEQFIMEPEESLSTLLSLFIPRHTTELGLLAVVENDCETLGRGIIKIVASSRTVSTLEKTEVAINSAFEDLLAVHNELSERYLQNQETVLKQQNQALEAAKQLAQLPGHSAVDAAAQHTIGVSILSIQYHIQNSQPSQISNIVTSASTPKKSIFVFALVGLIAGIFSGCGFVFFLELISLAKTRLTDTG